MCGGCFNLVVVHCAVMHRSTKKAFECYTQEPLLSEKLEKEKAKKRRLGILHFVQNTQKCAK